MIVRPARRDDLAALAPIATRPLLQRYAVTPAGLERDLARALDDGDGLLVADDGGPRGFAWFQPRGALGSGGYLKLIAIRPGEESRGLGAALLDGVERAVVAESRHLFLLVSDFNVRAQRFYQAHGYTRAGVLPRLVLADVDELLYWKRLR